jgi:ATP-dependent RNA helicase RhlE
VQFSDLALIEPIQRAVARAGYTTPSPIQQAAVPPALLGKDVLGCAQTGTGKTAAFSLPILQRIDALAGKEPALRALILTPTRELAAQIGESLATYGKDLDLYHTVIFGGVSDKAQIHELKEGVDILVATPGRLLDLMQRRFVDLSKIEVFVLDEADRMLDMGFIHDVRKVVAALPSKRQTLFFSATMPDEIKKLADKLLRDPVVVSVTPVSSTAEKIDQAVYFVDRATKPKLLLKVLGSEACKRVLVFSRTKHGANRIADALEKARVSAAAIHGNKSQGARTRALEGFRNGEVRVLVATDIAARGIDVDGVTHVINYDIPNVAETYVHRIGRTARAGAEGIAFSFCESEERGDFRAIERLIGKKVPELESGFAPSPASANSGSDAGSRDRQGPSGRSNGPSRNPHGASRNSSGYGRPASSSGGGRPSGRSGRPGPRAGMSARG